jgi:hypothetical protein
MTDAYLPPGRPGDARWNAPGRRVESPEQERLRHQAHLAGWFVVASAVMLATFVGFDLLEIRGIRDTPHPTVHRARGMVDVVQVSRFTMEYRLDPPGAEPMQFKCRPRVAATPRCPVGSQDWFARPMTIEWIDMPVLLPGLTAARATHMDAGDDPLFEASPRAVQDAEVATLEESIPEAFRVFGFVMLGGAALAAFHWVRLRRLTARIEAAHRRAHAAGLPRSGRH